MNNKLGNLDIFVEKTSESAATKLALDLSAYLKAKKENSHKVLFLSSGSSALSVLDFISEEVFGEYLTIGVLDERYDKTNENNNFTLLAKTDFYKKAKEFGCDFIDTRVKDDESQGELANYFEERLKEWLVKNPNGDIVATVGVGLDGHTSGIMPFPEDLGKFSELFEGGRLVVSYDASGKNPFTERITTTITFLKKTDRVFVFMCGETKSNALLNIQKDGSFGEIPARILKELNGGMYLDEVVLK